ncbi:MAG TPA: GFA family protein [Candidatus Latescibacteria bacterium]|nr:GFA family protein [Candidatus Latescibacterota bacterium]
MTASGQADGAVAGGCLCGAVRWRADGPPRASVLCHCDTCRLATGAGAVGWLIFPVEAFHMVSGTPETYHTDTDADRTFCPTCGSLLTYHHHGDRPGDMDVTTGTADDGDAFPPTKDVFLEEKLAWVTAVGDTIKTGDHA